MSVAGVLEKYVFYADWMDPHAQLVRSYTLTFYPEDSSFEMYDLKSKRIFLKKTKQPGVTLNDLLVGSSVTVLSRQLTITGYADETTSLKLGRNVQTAVLIIQAELYDKFGKIIDYLHNQGFHLLNARFFQNTNVSNNRMLVVQVARQDAYSILERLLDYAIYADLSLPSGSIVGSNNETEAKQEADKLFKSQNFPRTAKFEKSTCCLIKPHAVSNGQSGKIIDAIIKAGFEITDLQMYQLAKVDAEEFLQVYKNVVPEYHQMVDQLSSSPLIALEIYKQSESIVSEFKDFCGPPDPELAQVIRPKSLRAQFGEDAVKNAVHCTDVPDDAVLEIEYFFHLLSRN